MSYCTRLLPRMPILTEMLNLMPCADVVQIMRAAFGLPDQRQRKWAFLLAEKKLPLPRNLLRFDELLVKVACRRVADCGSDMMSGIMDTWSPPPKKGQRLTMPTIC